MERHIRDTLLSAQGTDGITYALVTCDDGTYGISKDGELIEESPPGRGRLHDYAQWLLELTGLDDKGKG